MSPRRTRAQGTAVITVHQPAECRVRDVAKGIAANAAPDIAASVTADSTAGGTVHVIRSFLNWAPPRPEKAADWECDR
jgi:hypothetical protein